MKKTALRFGSLHSIFLSLAMLAQGQAIKLPEKRVDAYQFRPGLLVLPAYSEPGKLCRLVLQKQVVLADGTVSLDPEVSTRVIEEALDKIVPATVRGNKRRVPGGLTVKAIVGTGIVSSDEYERVTISRYASSTSALPGSVAVVVQWMTNPCPP